MIRRQPVPLGSREELNSFNERDRYRGRIVEDYIDQSGVHKLDWRDAETAFAAEMLFGRFSRDERILDIGSNRLFINGLCASLKVISLDVRPRVISTPNETLLLGDSKNIPLPDGSVDTILCLNALEHFGLGRYGDRIDPDADYLAVAEWRRVLRPGGLLVFSTTISSRGEFLAFNAHRIYSYERIHALCEGFQVCRESYFCNSQNRVTSLAELSTPEFGWDLYCGAWTLF